MPFTGVIVLLGVFALTGFPPFSLFISELMILTGAFTHGSYLVSAVLLSSLAVIFGAFIYHFGKILFGNLPKEMVIREEPLSSRLVFLFLLFLLFVPAAGFMFINKELLWIAQNLFQR